MIIPLNVASDGYLMDGINTLSIASNGYIFNITIEEITVPIGSGIGAYNHKPRKNYVKDNDVKKLPTKEEKKTKITVKCVIDGRELTKTKKVKKVGVKLSDVKIEIDDKNKIKIKVDVK